MQARQVCVIIGVLVMLSVAQVALGATYYFMGDDNHEGNWNDPGDWTPPGTPGQNDTAIIGVVNGQVVNMHCYVTDDQSTGVLVVKGTGTT